MKVKVYPVIEMAVEDGVLRGFNWAYKHTDTPDPTVLRSHIVQFVMDELCNWVDFEDRPDEAG